MGREQLDLFASEGVDLKHVVVGHCCGSADLRYHVDMLDRGCYLGFDRFGIDIIHPDRLRKAALIGLLGIGFEERIVLSCDTMWCWRGRQFAGAAASESHPRHLFASILPALRAAGVQQEKIDKMLIGNPRRFFTE